MKPIPITAAQHIAKLYGYDQVVVIGRKVGENPDPHGEHVTTYGVDKEHCKVAARIGEFLKYKVMNWAPEPSFPVSTDAAARATGACAQAIEVFEAEGQVKEALEYMREVLLHQEAISVQCDGGEV